LPFFIIIKEFGIDINDKTLLRRNVRTTIARGVVEGNDLVVILLVGQM
jgi:hypothetical protein